MSAGSDYTFKLCSSADDLREAYRLRLEVFHKEQGFPEDTEIDEYDPNSAHFILTSKKDGKVVATVRLTPYPRPHASSSHSSKSQSASTDTSIPQNDTAMVTSGGGPGGTSGGLAMTTSATSNPSPSSHLPTPKSNMEYHTGKPTETMAANRITDADIEKKLKGDHHGFPLGGSQSESSLAHEFRRKLVSKEPFKEVEGAPNARGAKLSRLAVCGTMRGKGLGALTVRESEAWLLRILGNGGEVRQDAVDQGDGKTGAVEGEDITIVASSQMHAKGFYETLGYSVYGEPFDEEGAPHCFVMKRLVYEASL